MTPTPNSRFLWLLAAAVALNTTACGDDHDHDHPIDEHPCRHVTGGPFGSLTAGTDPASAPAPLSDHTWYTVSLPLLDAGPERLGYLALTIDADGDYVLFMNADVPLEVIDAAGTSLPAESSGDGSGACAITRYVVYDLEVGSHDLIVGPTDLEQMNVILEEMEDDGHHHH